MVAKTSYSNVNSNIKFDDLVKKFENTTDKQLRVKDSKQQGKVQVGTKEEKGGFWATLSGRSGTFTKAENFVLKRLQAAVGDNVEISKNIKDLIKADQTAVEGDANIGDMLKGVRNAWHQEVKAKYSDDSFVDELIDKSSLDANQKETHRNELKQRIQNAISQEISGSPDKTLRDATAKRIAGDVVTTFANELEDQAIDQAIDQSQMPQAQKTTLKTGKWNNWDPKRDCTFRSELRNMIKDEVKQEEKRTGVTPLPLAQRKLIINKLVKNFANVANGTMPRPDVSQMNQQESSLALQQYQEFGQKSHAERSAILAKKMIASNPQSSNDMSGAARNGQARLLFMAMQASENVPVQNGQPTWDDCCAEVSKELIRKELSVDVNSLMRQGNPASSFNGCYMEHTAGDYRDTILNTYQQRVNSELEQLQPFTYTDKNGMQQKCYDFEELSKEPPKPRFQFPEGSANDIGRKQALQAYHERGVEAGRILLDTVSNSYGQLPEQTKTFLKNIATVSDNPAVQKTVINDSISLRLISPKPSVTIGNPARGEGLDANDPNYDRKRMNALTAYSGSVVFQNCTNNLEKKQNSVWKQGARWDMTKEVLFNSDAKAELAEFYEEFMPESDEDEVRIVIGGNRQPQVNPSQVNQPQGPQVQGNQLELPPQPWVMNSFEQGTDELQTMISTYESRGYPMNEQSLVQFRQHMAQAGTEFRKGDNNEAMRHLGLAQNVAIDAVTTALSKGPVEVN